MPFRDITGHRRVIGLLARSIARDRLPPSLIFGGPRGLGKARTAIALAQALNCLTPVRDGDGIEIDGCGTCAACRRIARGVHPDVLWIEPGESGSIKIEQVRAATDTLMYRPFEGRRRVVIVDQAEALGVPPQNALLKTLEEPGASSAFVLVTSRPDSLLATVRSRCARLRFSRLSAGEVASVLVGDHGYTERDARAVAALADGSIGQALEARAADFAAARQNAHEVLRAVVHSAAPQKRIETTRDLLPRKSPNAAFERDYLSVHLRAMASLVRDLGILNAGADRSALANADLESSLAPIAGGFDHDRTVRAFTAIDQALDAIEYNVSPKTVADWIVLQL